MNIEEVFKKISVHKVIIHILCYCCCFLQTAEAEREAEVGSGSGATAEGRLFSPKIFYTPNNTCVQSIIHRANRTFAVAGIIVDWSHSAATCTAYLLQNDTKSSIITVCLTQ